MALKHNQHSFPKVLFQVVVSIALICIIFQIIDRDHFWNSLKAVDMGFYALAVFLYIIRNWAGAYRCQVLLEVFGKTTSLVFQVKWYFIGFFYNMFLPSTLGGDLARAYAIAKQDIALNKVTAVILLERFWGLWSFTVLAMICYWQSTFYNTLIGMISFWAVGLLCVSMLLIYFYVVNQSKALSWTPDSLSRLKNALIRFAQSLAQFRDHKKDVIKALLASLVYQFLKIVAVYCLVKAVGINMSFADCAFVFPMIEILTTVPVSFNGIGVRELTFLLYLKYIDVSQAHSVSLSALVTSMLIILGLIGGFIHLLSKSMTLKGSFSPR